MESGISEFMINREDGDTTISTQRSSNRRTAAGEAGDKTVIGTAPDTSGEDAWDGQPVVQIEKLSQMSIWSILSCMARYREKGVAGLYDYPQKGNRMLLSETLVPVRTADENDDTYAARYQTALKCLVLYWTDDQRRTWYQLNEWLLDAFLHLLYRDKATSPRFSAKVREGCYSSKVEKSLYIETPTADVTPLSESDTEDPSESEDSEISRRLHNAEQVQRVTDQPTDAPAPANYTLYAEQIGRPDAGVGKQLDVLVRQYGTDAVENTIVQAGQYGAKHIGYVFKILQNRKQPHRRSTPAPAPQSALQKRWWESEVQPSTCLQQPLLYRWRRSLNMFRRRGQQH
jgi:hypothetical protein